VFGIAVDSQKTHIEIKAGISSFVKVTVKWHWDTRIVIKTSNQTCYYLTDKHIEYLGNEDQQYFQGRRGIHFGGSRTNTNIIMILGFKQEMYGFFLLTQ